MCALPNGGLRTTKRRGAMRYSARGIVTGRCSPVGARWQPCAGSIPDAKMAVAKDIRNPDLACKAISAEAYQPLCG